MAEVKTTTMSLFGSDTITVGGRLIKNLCSGEVGKDTYQNDLGTVKTGKNGSAIFIKNETGYQATIEVHVIRGSEDDIALDTYIKNYLESPDKFVLLSAVVAKPFGTGAGEVQGSTGGTGKTDKLTLNNGIPTKNVDVVVNLDGDSEQAISVYTYVFASTTRSIG